MSVRYWIPGFVGGGVGAVLAFALVNDDSVLGIRLRPLGVILLVIGVLFLLAGVVQWLVRSNRGASGEGQSSVSRAESIKSIGGLVAVSIGVGAVAALTIVIITTTTNLDSSSIVAISTSAFAVVSTVVGAYVGVKIGSDGTSKAVEEVKASSAIVGAATAKLTTEQRAEVHTDVADATKLAQAVGQSAAGSI